MDDAGRTGLELRSRITPENGLELSLEERPVGEPGPEELIVRVEAAPLNPSDLALLLGPADLSTGVAGGTAERPTYTAAISPSRMRALSARLGKSLPVGIEGAGTVIATGANATEYQGRVVSMLGGGMYAQFRKVGTSDCVLLPEGAQAAHGASLFVNPLTALAMVETLRQEGHTALVHTAAASNLGRMLNRVCQADGIPLVNIVRSADQAAILREIGAEFVVNSTSANFRDELAQAIAETGATLAFDAIGGGTLASAILHAMEAAAIQRESAYSRYGSSTWKQVYIYGSLDPSATVIDRGFGLSWGVSGFLLTPFLDKIGASGVARLKARVVSELRTTFASPYTDVISLRDALSPEIIERYARRATGSKYLIDPTR